MIVLCAGTNANLMGSENVPKIKLQPTNLKKTLWMTGCRPVQMSKLLEWSLELRKQMPQSALVMVIAVA